METGISVYCISFTLSLLVLIFFCYSGLTLLDALFLGLIAYSSYCSVIDFYYCMSSSFFSRISIEFYCSGFYYTGIDGGRIGARFCAFVNGGGGGFERFGGFLVGGAGKLDIPTCFTIIDFVNIRTHDYINLIMYSNNVYHSIIKHQLLILQSSNLTVGKTPFSFLLIFNFKIYIFYVAQFTRILY